jgi:hypothetical protein
MSATTPTADRPADPLALITEGLRGVLRSYQGERVDYASLIVSFLPDPVRGGRPSVIIPMHPHAPPTGAPLPEPKVTKVPPCPPDPDEEEDAAPADPRAAALHWWAFAVATCQRLTRDANRLLAAVTDPESPLHGAIAPESLERFAGAMQDVDSHILSAVAGLADTPDPLAGLPD